MNLTVLFRSVALGALGLALLSPAGCMRGGSVAGASFVPISYEKFQPDMTPLGDTLKGKAVVLQDFYNRAENTQASTYFNNADQGRTYGNPNSGAFGIGGRPLESYFWYCFEKAFTNAGLTVLKEDSGSGAGHPGLRITLTSIDENRFAMQVELTRKAAVVLTKTIEVSEAPPQPGHDEVSTLEERAYRMMNKAAQAVLADPEIQKELQS
jgi:hypothetical protein